MAAPMDLPDETRHQVANDCERAAHLLATEGWLRHKLWHDGPHYTGGALCAVGALAVAHNEQAARHRYGVTDDVYEDVGSCPAGKAVAAEIQHRYRAHSDLYYPDRADRLDDHLADPEWSPRDKNEFIASFVTSFNDDRDVNPDGDTLISLLRDVAAKYRPDEADGGLM